MTAIDELEKLESFLDKIENPNENVVQEFESNFNIANSNEVNLMPNIQNEDIKICDGDKVFDGNRYCIFKGVTQDNKPIGNGALLYANKDVFTGTFNGSIGDRKGILKGAENGSILHGQWKNGKLSGFFIRDSGKGTIYMHWCGKRGPLYQG